MDKLLASRPFAMALGALMLVAGLALGSWALRHFPPTAPTTTATNLAAPSAAEGSTPDGQHQALTVTTALTTTMAAQVDAAPRPTPAPVLQVTLGAGVPGSLSQAINSLVLSTTLRTDAGLAATQIVTATGGASQGGDPVAAHVTLDIVPAGGTPAYTEYFAAATRFDAVAPELTRAEVRAIWRGRSDDFSAVAVLTDTLPGLIQALGEPGDLVTGVASVDDAVRAAWHLSPTLTILPFEQLVPSLTVIPIDGQNPVENGNHFDPDAYPLTATIYAHVDSNASTESGDETAAAGTDLADRFLAALPTTNRRPDRLTVVAMTGVTAMVRRTAEQMDTLGTAWPAEIVGPELASADITHISNEVPFVPGCETNTNPENLTFCSKPEYMDALTASGVDIIGLTGNHQNDYGIVDALTSLEIYAEAGLPVYGGGINRDAAFAPLIIEHNGNRLAFLGANSYGPDFAWATDILPGSAPFDLAIMSATIRNLKAKDLADVVLPELQYMESYNTTPLVDQRLDFTALVRAGADIVTGVQSHVAQGVEFEDGKLVLYGLGNLYFDQMTDDSVRQGLIVKHTIYAGRHISTQLLPTVLEEYGQPRWATPAEREAILARVFGASYWEY